MFLIASEVQAKKAEPLNIIAGTGLILNRVDHLQKSLFTTQVDPETTWGVSAIAKGSLSKWFELEANVTFARYQFIREAPFQIVYEKCTRIHIPILLRFRPFNWLSFGAGPYASYRMGTVAGPAIASEYQTSAYDQGEHGLEGAFGFTFPVPDTKYMLSIDFRYAHSLTPRPSEKEYFQSVLVSLQTFLKI